MIAYIKYSKLDILKYDHCIANSVNSRIFAYSWYLNCVTDQWDALVLNDYEAVMPLPIRKKYGISYVYQAPWIQQLGVFSKKKLEKTLIIQFIVAIPKKIILVDYLFNSNNLFDSKFINERTNYVLDLDKDFDAIKKSYNQNKKRISAKNFDNFKLNKNGDISTFLRFYKEQKFNFKTHKDAFEKLEKLLHLKKKSVHIWTVYKGQNIIGALVWLKDKIRITYLIPIATTEAKKYNMPTYLVNELIKEHQNSSLILDFEGSMIDGVAKFYKSFGAKQETYYWYKKRLI